MKKKKKKSKHKKGFCYVHMKPEELMLYSPEFYDSKDEAFKNLMLDCYDIAEHNGYDREQLFMPGVGEILNKIEILWDTWDEVEAENGEDQQGRTKADNQ